MTKTNRAINDLPTVSTSAGAERRVGLEFEFGGLDLVRTAEIVRSCLEGKELSETAAEKVIAVDGLGKFKIEVDWSFLKNAADEEEAPSEAMSALSQAAALLVPIEIVCPPIAVSDLPLLDSIVDSLRAAGAQGTEQSLLYAFGLHINTEIPDCSAATIDRYLKAYALLQTWLVSRNSVNLSRRITSYIDLYSEEYLLRVLSRENPSISTLFDDYLEHNPTRNRALDMLPLLAEIDEARVRKAIDDPRIKARPAFHYRLPDCRIDDKEWSLAQPWNLWCVVEKLADDKNALQLLGREALTQREGKNTLFNTDWENRIDSWLEESV